MSPASRTSKGLTFDRVLALARELPGTEESTSYGTRSIKVKGVLLARLREDGETLALRTPMVVRDYLLQTAPKVFFLEDHYRPYPWVLVHLSAAKAAQIRELLEDAWRSKAPKRAVAAHDGAKPTRRRAIPVGAKSRTAPNARRRQTPDGAKRHTSQTPQGAHAKRGADGADLKGRESP
jgi:hypothetical protein